MHAFPIEKHDQEKHTKLPERRVIITRQKYREQYQGINIPSIEPPVVNKENREKNKK